MFVNNKNIGQTSSFWSNIEMLVKNRKGSSKIEIFVEYQTLSKTMIYMQFSTH